MINSGICASRPSPYLSLSSSSSISSHVLLSQGRIQRELLLCLCVLLLLLLLLRMVGHGCMLLLSCIVEWRGAGRGDGESLMARCSVRWRADRRRLTAWLVRSLHDRATALTTSPDELDQAHHSQEGETPETEGSWWDTAVSERLAIKHAPRPSQQQQQGNLEGNVENGGTERSRQGHPTTTAAGTRVTYRAGNVENGEQSSRQGLVLER
jgi:hypothetical protein